MSIGTPTENGFACDLCGSKKFELLHEWPTGDVWNPSTAPIAVWQCKACRLVSLFPVPTPEQMPEAGDWWSPERKEFRRRWWFKSRWRKLRYKLFRHPQARLLRATRRVIKSGRLLDVGCGHGELLRRAGPFYQCTGLDPSARAVEAVKTLGFPVIESTFDDAKLKPASFDLVLMYAMIEHVRSPMQALRKANSILRMNGVVVLQTPKFNGPSYRKHQRGWNGFRHGYHTFLFSGRTLGQYLEQTGFEVLEHPRRDRRLDDILILWGRKTREL